jgi:hypothetical protein
MKYGRVFIFLFCALSGASTFAQLQYVPLSTPCRAVDTRLNGATIAEDTTQNLDPGQACGIPSQGNNPIVFALNVTAIPHGRLGAMTVWATGAPQPNASTLNSNDGRIKANYALVAGGAGTGLISVWASNATDLVLDVSGYFVQPPASGISQALLYTPVAPCRLIDTRNSTGVLGSPSLTAGETRTFSLAGQCNLPDLSDGGALSVNVTAVPKGSLGYLTVWGSAETGNSAPLASTLNSPTGTVVANAAFLTINPGTNTSINAYAFNDTDLIVDVTGYFSKDSTGLAYYPTAVPQRILDTRTSTNPADGTVFPTGGLPFTANKSLSYSASQATYVLNATIVPTGPLWYLTLYPDGLTLPTVSTLNAYDASVTSNMAIVSTGTDGVFDAYADGTTQLILDLSGSFMPLPTGSPSVVFVGDEISAALLAAAQPQPDVHPGWLCVNCLSTTTSTFALANLPAAIAMKPQVVHILVGVHELSAPGVVANPTNPTDLLLDNIKSMVTLLQGANIRVAVGDLPPCPLIDTSLFNLGFAYLFTTFGGPNELHDVSVIDYSSIPRTTCPGDGIDPNTEGYSVMVPLAEQGVDQALQ